MSEIQNRLKCWYVCVCVWGVCVYRSLIQNHSYNNPLPPKISRDGDFNSEVFANSASDF